jgi:hypothetical protein
MMGKRLEGSDPFSEGTAGRRGFLGGCFGVWVASTALLNAAPEDVDRVLVQERVGLRESVQPAQALGREQIPTRILGRTVKAGSHLFEPDDDPAQVVRDRGESVGDPATGELRGIVLTVLVPGEPRVEAAREERGKDGNEGAFEMIDRHLRNLNRICGALFGGMLVCCWSCWSIYTRLDRIARILSRRGGNA